MANESKPETHYMRAELHPGPRGSCPNQECQRALGARNDPASYLANHAAPGSPDADDAAADLKLLCELRDAAVRWHDNVGDDEAEGALVLATERAAPKYWLPGEWPKKVEYWEQKEWRRKVGSCPDPSMMDRAQSAIGGLASKAARAGAQDAARRSAIAAERDAEAAALEAVIDAARPGLAAICGRLPTGAEGRGLTLATTTKDALWILLDGSLAKASPRGIDGRTQASVTPLTAREAVAIWDLDEVIAALSAAFDGVLKGKAEAATEAAQARAEKLRAILVLVR